MNRKHYEIEELFALLGLRYIAHYTCSSDLREQIQLLAQKKWRAGSIPKESLWRGQLYRKEIEGALEAPLHARWIGKEFGWGIFASKRIQEGDFICCYLGELRSIKRRQVNRYCFSFPLQPWWRPLLGGWTIDAEKMGNSARFINHSDHCNCESSYAFLSPWPYIVITARRVIEKGEQLSYDYGAPYWRSLEKYPLPSYVEDVKIDHPGSKG